MSDAAAGAALVVEQVLLYDASLLTIGRKRVAAAEFLINESLYPNINGSHRGTAIAKEANAVCYLFADAVQLEEAGKESVVGQRCQSTEVECAAGSLCGSVLDVTGAVAQTTAHQLRPREAAELLRNITVYHCMRRDQLLRLYPGKEGVIENLLRYLVKQQRIFYNTDRDCYGDVPDCREDRELTAALWVLLDFIEKVEYHSPDNMPAKLVFFADGEVYEVVYVGPGKEALLQHALAAEDDSGQRLVIIEEEDQMQHLHIPHIAAYCMVDEQGCVQYFRKEEPCGQSHPLAADREHFE